jgi:hypothetical protein
MRQYILISIFIFSYLTPKVENRLVLINKAKQTNRREKTFKLIYNAIGCSCAQWSETKFNTKPEKRIYYYLERANSKLIDAEKLWNGNNIPLEIEVTGEIITEIGLPKNYKNIKGQAEPGKVFRYTKIKVIQNGMKKNSQ